MLSGLFDCFVIPSKMEGLPISMIEAVAAGLYVVCTDAITNDVAHAFPDRVTMLPLSAPLERWAEAIEYAIQHRIPPEQGLELVRNSPMTFEHFTQEMIKIYETVDS
jgi:glycosyltransferase involved in cell wall biosynthesis